MFGNSLLLSHPPHLLEFKTKEVHLKSWLFEKNHHAHRRLLFLENTKITKKVARKINFKNSENSSN